MIPIKEIAKKINLDESSIEYYGKYKAKINYHSQSEKAEVILVTAMNPTPYGEGKTTVAIGLNDALNKIGKKSIATLREPSLGPVFGLKGGACGGGKAQVIPSEDINLHFNGDFHAITSANNLIAAALDNSIYFDNLLNIDINKIYFKRCLDMNDRSLRNITINDKKINREEGFNITAASEIMSILCISKDLNDFENRINDIILAKKTNGEYLYLKELNITGSIMALMREALKPNLVQSLEENPIVIHGGPFANISTGISSVISLKLSRGLADYVVTEAGFGFDLGGFKFTDIICRDLNINPKIVFIVTIRALKYNGEDNLDKGLENMKAHIEALNNINASFVITINKFNDDKEEELNKVIAYANNLDTTCIINNVYEEGATGALALAKYITSMETKPLNFLYKKEDSIKNKINNICKNIFHTENINYNEIANQKIEDLEKMNCHHLICIAKTPLSISDDQKKLGYPKDFILTITNISIHNGAKLIIVHMGNILLMPGLPKKSNAEIIYLDHELNIKNLQ